jgi:hypothetical protein
MPMRNMARQYGLLLTLCWLMTSACWGQTTANNDSAAIDISTLLSAVGVSAALAQVDTIITQTAAALDDSQQIQRQLQQASNGAILFAATEAYVATNLSANNQLRAQQLLQDELLTRVGNFDVALEMPGALDKFRAFQQQAKNRPASDERKQLIQRLDAALGSSVIAAMLQTEIEVSAFMLLKRQTAELAPSSKEMSERRQQRQQYMAAVTGDLNLYSYRFMQNAELQRYVELLEQEALQALLYNTIKGLQQALQASRAIALQ